MKRSYNFKHSRIIWKIVLLLIMYCNCVVVEVSAQYSIENSFSDYSKYISEVGNGQRLLFGKGQRLFYLKEKEDEVWGLFIVGCCSQKMEIVLYCIPT